MNVRSVVAALTLICCSLLPLNAAADGGRLRLSLHQALDLARENNLQYLSALADERIAHAQLRQASAGLLPDLRVNYAYEHTQSPRAITMSLPGPGGGIPLRIPLSEPNSNIGNAALQYVIYSGGAIHANIGVASAAYSAAEEQAAATKNNLDAQIVKSYFDLIEAREFAAIADQSVQVATLNVQTAQHLLAAGVTAKVDVLRQRLTLANAQSSKIVAYNQLSLANAALANLLNVNLSALITPTEQLDETPRSVSLDTALQVAQQHRPELLAASDAVALAKYAVRAARSTAKPLVVLGLSETKTHPNLFTQSQPVLTTTLSATWSLFDGGLTAAKVEQAQAQVDKASLELQVLDHSIDLDVRQAYFNYEAAVSRIGVARAAVSAADEGLRLSRLRYANGAGTSLELSDALLSDTKSHTDLVQALADAQTAYAALQRAQGLPL